MKRKQLSNPTSTGGAGTHFEAKVAAQYLLAMLASMPGRGLPGVRLNRVRLQQAPEGTPLDDIVLEGTSLDGASAQLDIQVKHKVSFSPKDGTFKDVCNEIAQTIKQNGFFDRHHMLAIAIAKTSAKIAGPYQDVLTWARELDSASVFFQRLNMKKVANDDMRTFVRTFQDHLKTAGAPCDEDAIWKTLRRVLILPFDFSATESAALALVEERASHCLTGEDIGKTKTLWNALVQRALEMGRAGGAIDQEALRTYLKDLDFKLARDRRHHKPLSIISENTRLAFNRIDDRIGHVSLARQHSLERVRSALDNTRYVEIQGDSGVGKSGLLKRIGIQQLEQGRVVVLAPGSVTPRGWTHMREVIGFSGTCREFLTELALEADGYILIDNLDRFTPDEQITVLDILGEASNILGVKILVTARRPLDPDAPRWLEQRHIQSFNPGPAILIDELLKDELEELRERAPKLKPLLGDDHPARAVARNLFRLSRIAHTKSETEVPYSEVALMHDWWRTGDGGDPSDETDIRDRQKLIRALATHAAASNEPLDVSSHPTRTVDRLIKQKTLVEFQDGRVDFYHDVLREWAISTLIIQFGAPSLVFDLSAYATPIQARSMELVCCDAMLKDSTGDKWTSLLADLSKDGAHAIWARTGLLSAASIGEIKGIAPAAESYLLANDAGKFCELIRTVRAVHVSPGRAFYEKIGFDGAAKLPEFAMPTGAAWYRLILWTNQNMARIPAKAYFDICELYMDWGLGFLGRPPLGSVLSRWFYFWLTQIEKARDADRYRRAKAAFGGALSEAELDRLEDKARIAFLTFAHNSLDEVRAYLNSQRQRDDADETIDWIMKLSSVVASVAPQELADLTCDYLFLDRDSDDDDDWGMPPKRNIFRRVDDQFMPESPNQGPFLPLLNSHAEIGLDLINRVITHAVERVREGDQEDAFSIIWKGEVFTFMDLFSYGWTGYSMDGHSIVCALWALEQWGHNRLEKGDAPEAVINDVIGSSGSPAAFAGVAVHLIISNIDLCQNVGAPFLGCPDLLSIDIERPVRQRQSGIDLLGFGKGDEGTQNASARDALLSKGSRSNSLLDLIGPIALRGNAEVKSNLKDFLETARAKLPDVEPLDTLRSPSLAAQHALNMLNLDNWKSEKRDGNSFLRYQSPSEEEQHFDQLQSSDDVAADVSMLTLSTTAAVHDPTKSSPEFARQVVEQVQQSEALMANAGERRTWMSEDSEINAAMIAMRDGDADLKQESLNWARERFSELIGPDVQRPDISRTQANGTAFLGLIYSLSDTPAREECRLILEARFWPHDMHTKVVVDGLAVLHERSPRMVKALLRCRIRASLRSLYSWQVKDEEREQVDEQLRVEFERAIEAELDWMLADQSEPEWPELPKAKVRTRRGIRLSTHDAQPATEQSSAPEEIEKVYFEADNVAIWITGARSVLSSDDREWLFDLAAQYTEWTLEANGLDLDDDSRTRDCPTIWTNAISSIAADGFNFETGIMRLKKYVDGLFDLPEECFCSLSADFLLELDYRFFDDADLPSTAYVAMRKKMADHLGETNSLKWMVSRRRPSISFELGAALGRTFFCTFKMAATPECYLREQGIDQSLPFIPMLSEFCKKAPSYYSAYAVLSLVECGPRVEHLPLLAAASQAWLTQFPTQTEFWIEQSIGRRLIALLNEISNLEGVSAVLADNHRSITQLVSHLVKLGLAEAAQFEVRLASLSQ